MYTTRLETVHASVSVATAWCRSQVWGEAGGLQMNQFEQVTSHHHQMSLALGPQVWCSGGEGVPYLIFPMMHLMLHPPPFEQTNTCGIITFRKGICWR